MNMKEHDRNMKVHKHIEHESDGDRHKNLSINEHLDKIKSYLKNII